MSEVAKEIAIKALENELGNASDNLWRATISFKGQTPEQMQGDYGQSSRTKQEIVDGYQGWKDRTEAALEWLRGVPV